MVEKNNELSYGQICKIIDAYQKEYEAWVSNSDKIYQIYQNDKVLHIKRYPILYANVETLHPALFSKAPVPEIVRRTKASDDYSNAVTMILEQCCKHFVDESDFFNAIDCAVLDRLIVGRGQVWLRYEPVIKEVFNQELQQSFEQLVDEKIEFDYVHYSDFGHNIASSWQAVNQVWRKTRQSKRDILKQFPEAVIENINFKSTSNKDNEESSDDVNQVCEMYEFWDKTTAKVYYVIKDYENKVNTDSSGILGVKSPNNLFKDFFPCPKPLYGKVKNKTLIPIPDYNFYKDQADEMNKTTDNFYDMVDMIKVKGIFDSSVPDLGNLFTTHKTLSAVSSWKMVAEKGGLSGVIDFFDFKPAVEAMMALLNARNQQKQDLMDITGISDIVRGSSNPNETATAQTIKGKYVTVRLSKSQKHVEFFCRDLIIKIAEIIVNLFAPETINRIIDLQDMDEGAEMQVINQLKSEGLDYYRINIETDSTIQPDQEYEQTKRMQAVQGIGAFLMEALKAPPEMMPLIGEMLKFVVASYPQAKSLEQVVNTMIDDAVERSKQPPPQAPNPELQIKEIEVKGRLEEAQIKSSTELQKPFAQAEANIKQIRAENQMQIRQTVQAVSNNLGYDNYVQVPID